MALVGRDQPTKLVSSVLSRAYTTPAYWAKIACVIACFLFLAILGIAVAVVLSIGGSEAAKQG